MVKPKISISEPKLSRSEPRSFIKRLPDGRLVRYICRPSSDQINPSTNNLSIVRTDDILQNMNEKTDENVINQLHRRIDQLELKNQEKSSTIFGLSKRLITKDLQLENMVTNNYEPIYRELSNRTKSQNPQNHKINMEQIQAVNKQLEKQKLTEMRRLFNKEVRSYDEQIKTHINGTNMVRRELILAKKRLTAAEKELIVAKEDAKAAKEESKMVRRELTLAKEEARSAKEEADYYKRVALFNWKLPPSMDPEAIINSLYQEYDEQIDEHCDKTILTFGNSRHCHSSYAVVLLTGTPGISNIVYIGTSEELLVRFKAHTHDRFKGVSVALIEIAYFDYTNPLIQSLHITPYVASLSVEYGCHSYSKSFHPHFSSNPGSFSKSINEEAKQIASYDRFRRHYYYILCQKVINEDYKFINKC